MLDDFVFLMFFSSLLATPCKIILIRHGETDWNVQKKSQGWKDIPLNEKGRLQAEDLRIKFSSLDLKTIYTSSLLRALETAEIIGKEQITFGRFKLLHLQVILPF